MIDLDDFLIFAAINDAGRAAESDNNDDWLNTETESEPETFSWTEPVKHEEDNSKRDWYRREREQIEWEMEHANTYGFDKESIQQRLDYLDNTENALD